MPLCGGVRMWASLARHTAMVLALDLVYAASLLQAYVINAIVGEPQAITCWTCPNKTDNEACNNWAPDRICPTSGVWVRFGRSPTGGDSSLLGCANVAHPQDVILEPLNVHLAADRGGTDYTICQTIHRINVRTGESMLVNKRCALPSECSVDMVGCHDTHIPGVEDCISCCNYAYCNELVPSNYSTALMYSTVTNSASAISRQTPCLATFTSLVQMTLPTLLHYVCLTISLLTSLSWRTRVY